MQPVEHYITLHKIVFRVPKITRTARTLCDFKGVMWEYSYEGKQLEKILVFKRPQKTGRVCVDLMSGGRLFIQCNKLKGHSGAD